MDSTTEQAINMYQHTTLTCEQQHDVLDLLSDAFGVSIVRITQHPISRLLTIETLTKGSLTHISASCLLSQARFGTRLMGMIERTIPNFTQRQWEHVAQMVLDCVEMEGV